jgi:hypothetical protein
MACCCGITVRASLRAPYFFFQSLVFNETREKIPLRQFLTHTPKIYEHGKSSPVAYNFMRSSGRADPVRIGQSKAERMWKTIRSRKWFLMQMYERERIYKSSYDNLEIV